MRILYLHQYYRTPHMGGGLRSWHLARHLAAQGHQVKMITAWNGSTKRVEHEGNLEVVWLPIQYENRFSKAARITAFRRFVWLAYREATKKLPADIVFATSTPLTIGLVALALKWRHRVPYVFEVRDLWPQAPIELGAVTSPIKIRLLKMLEQLLYRTAHRIVALSPGMVDGIGSQFAHKTHLIPNFADTIHHTPAAEVPAGPTHIVYTGTFGHANNIPGLVDFIVYCQVHYPSQYRFTLSGEGSLWQHVANEKQRLSLDNLTLLPLGSRAQVAALLQTAHFAWVGFGPQPVLQTNSPNKFFDALAAGVPILLNMQGWLANIVEEHKIGICHQNDCGQTLTKLEAARPQWPQWKQNARQLAEEQFSKHTALKNIQDIIESLDN